jgi:undecaprenyl-phosphate 4-deoxy-4-formamido-L-arabinose transferase
VFVDIDPLTRNLDLSLIEKAITSRTKAILPVYLAGLPVDMDRLYAIAHAHGLRVIEDAAQAFGSTWHGKRIGSFGDIVSFSFHPNKNMTTIEGGALVLNNEDEAALAQKYRLQGITRTGFDGMDCDVPGGKFNLTDVAARVGIGQLGHIERFTAQRHLLAHAYFAGFENSPAVQLGMGLPVADFTNSNWHMFQITLPLERLTIDRAEFMARLRERGIGSGVHYPAIHLFTLYRARGFRAGMFPHAEHFGASTISLPLFTQMTTTDVARVCRAVNEICAAHTKKAGGPSIAQPEYGSGATGTPVATSAPRSPAVTAASPLPLPLPSPLTTPRMAALATAGTITRTATATTTTAANAANAADATNATNAVNTAPEVSVVIPVYNEEAGLPALFQRLYPALDTLGTSYEVIFVDDGSRDRSVTLLTEQFHMRCDTTRTILLNSNYGQHMAILAGFNNARGQIVVTLDADLQNPPEEIRKLVDKMHEGHDYVGTIRMQRQDSWWRRKASQLMNRLRERITHIKMADQGCMLRAYSRSVVDTINRCGELNTFIPALAYTFAQNPVEIEVAHEERFAGESKYSLYSLIRLNFDLVTGFSIMPLQWLSLTGLVLALFSVILFVLLVVRRFVLGAEVQGVFTLFAITFFLLGVILFALGLLGEYIGRIYQQVQARPRYLIQTILEQPHDDDDNDNSNNDSASVGDIDGDGDSNNGNGNGNGSGKNATPRHAVTPS